MQGLQKGVYAAVFMALSVTSVWAQLVQPDSYGFNQPISANTVVIAERAGERISVYSPEGLSFRLREINAPGASFIKLHFSEFRIPEGVVVEISNPDSSEVWQYSAKERDLITVDSDMGDDGANSFSAMSITGDSVIVRITGDLPLFDPDSHQIEIDSWLEGFPLGESKTLESAFEKFRDGPDSQVENACGSDERYNSVCWAGSNGWEYGSAAAVAKMITSRGEVCTAWRVGSGNHMFTAEHCVGKQSELDGSEIWFNYETNSCGGSSTTTAVKVTGGTLLKNSSSLDYTLFSVASFSTISGFPAYGLDVGDPAIGEPIFIPQHGLGQPQQIAIESDMNSSGECEVDALDLDGYASGSDIGYYCDTATSSSGSPVVSNLSGGVIALHHFGGCLNSGVKMSRIWADVSGEFNGQIPRSYSGGGGGGTSSGDSEAPQADFSFSCDGLDCEFDGSGSTDSDGSVASYSWDLGDGNAASGVDLSHSFSAGGSYDVTLTVQDDEGDSDNTLQSISVIEPNQDPKATFSATCVNNSCDFNGSNSYDPDGSVASMSWDLGDGNTASGSTVQHDYQSDGLYAVSLTVTDDEGAFDKANRNLNVTMPNESPVSSFTFDCNDLECSFDAGSSSDPDGQITSWNWDFGEGATANGNQSTHTFPQAGNYSITLSVTDDRGASDDSIQPLSVSASNQAPLASFTYNCNDLACIFDAGNSSDPDGNLTDFNWGFGDGANASGQQASHAFAGSGTFQVMLTVLDDASATDKRTQSITVTAPNQGPQADFAYSCNHLSCSFDASASSDSDGSITSWGWNFGDGNQDSGTHASHSFSNAGSFTIVLAVSDDSGSTDSLSKTIQVSAANNAPQANFSYSCSDQTCSFNASSSSDSDGTVTSWNWNFGDGGSASGQQANRTFAGGGNFQVMLIVSDDAGATGSRTQSITVAAPNQGPQADFTYSCKQLICSFDASVSSDSDGNVASWGWSFGDGNQGSGTKSSHSFSSAGSYTVALTVSDDSGSTDSRSRTLQLSVSNDAPQAYFTFNCTDLACTFDAGSSTDSDGNVTAWNWSFGDGASASGQQVSHEFTGSGSFPVRLDVTDNEGASDNYSKDLNVSAQQSNDTPQARFTVECDELSCRFDAGTSRDPDGSIADFRWILSDGSNLNGQIVDHHFDHAGSFRVILTVEDDEGKTGSRSSTMEIEDARPEILLSGHSNQNNDKTMATLRWSGAETDYVEVFRDGVLVANTRNDGKLIDTKVKAYAKSASYWLCQPASGYCSDILVIRFRSGTG